MNQRMLEVVVVRVFSADVLLLEHQYYISQLWLPVTQSDEWT